MDHTRAELARLLHCIRRLDPSPVVSALLILFHAFH